MAYVSYLRIEQMWMVRFWGVMYLMYPAAVLDNLPWPWVICIGPWEYLFILLWLFEPMYRRRRFRKALQQYSPSIELALAFSKAKVLSKMSQESKLSHFGNIVVARDMGVAVEFLDNDKLRVTGREKEISKFNNLLNVA